MQYSQSVHICFWYSQPIAVRAVFSDAALEAHTRQKGNHLAVGRTPVVNKLLTYYSAARAPKCQRATALLLQAITVGTDGTGSAFTGPAAYQYRPYATLCLRKNCCFQLMYHMLFLL